MAVTVTELKSPLYQRHGEALLKILPETTAEQVRTGDGSTVETKLTEVSTVVGKSHEHVNKAVLDRLSVSGGQVAVDGAVMKHILTVAVLPETLPADLVEGGLLIVDASSAK